jgi:calcineurin-like phosphoesterase family protein
MSEVFLTSDTHWGHVGVCKFVMADGTKCRPWTDPDQMDEDMVKLWNSTVSPNDKVYHLGDVVINRKALKLLHRLNGNQVLIKGNHDIFRLEEYLPFYRDIRAYHMLDKYMLTHMPIHEESLSRYAGNIHGHLHNNRVMKDGKIDPRYLCVSVEHTNYKPINFEEVKLRFKNQQEF